MRLITGHRSLLMVCLAYLSLAMAWSLWLPLGEAPDEPGHYNYARIVASHGRLPEGEEEHEAFQPPLYYAFTAPLVGLGDTSRLPIIANADFRLDGRGSVNLLLHSRDESFPWASWALGWHLQRLTSVLIGFFSMWGLYSASVAIGARPVSAALGAGLFCLTPQFTMLHGASSNDSLALCLGIWLFRSLLVAVMKKRGTCPTSQFALGVLWGLGILAKVSILAAGPSLALAIWCGSSGEGGVLRRLRDVLVRLSLVAGGAAVVCGWWFVQNVWRYEHPLGWELIMSLNQVRRRGPDWPSELWGLYRSFWFHYVGLSFPSWLYLVLLLPTCGIVIAALSVCVGARNVCLSRACPLVSLWTASFFLAWVRWAQTVEGTDQARLLYPGLAPLLTLVGVGFSRLLGRPRVGQLAAALLSLVVALNIYAFGWRMMPAFAPASRIRLHLVPKSGSSLQFDKGLVLLSYRIPAEVAAPGDLSIEMWWTTRKPDLPNILLELRLVAEDGRIPVWKRGSPSAGRDTTDRWRPGYAVPSVHLLPLPAELPAGVYRLEAGVLEADDDQWLADASGQKIVALGTIRIISGT